MADETKPAGVIAWLVTLVVPPVVAGGLGQQFVAHHAALAVVIGGAYVAAVAVGGFFAVIARDVSSRWQARLADRVDLFLQRKGPRFERRYRQLVLDGLRFTDTKGLATVGPFTPEHDAVFVDVSLVPRPPQQIRPSILPELAGGRAGRRALGYFLGRAEPVVLAVVGSPGSGKTTLLRHAARQACMLSRSRSGRRDHVRDIPVLLYLRDHAAAIVAEPAVSVAALLRTTLGPAGADEPPGWLEQRLGDGRCLVLLDGLDEVARPDDRARVSAWAEAQVRQYPHSSFVISSRPRGYQSAPVGGAEIVQVCGFTGGQVEGFIRGWYRAAERHSTGTAGPEAEALAAQGAADLLQRLGQVPALYDLAVNPLLLTMIANVHRYRGALPGSRADLYSEICQVMLWRRQEAKQLPQQVSGDKKEAILRSLAYTMMGRRVSDLSRAEVLAEVQPVLRRVSRGVTSDGFLADASSNGLLIERETGQYSFAHKTFQEYLAAAHIRERGLVSVLADAVSDDWWAETTLLYAAKSNADPIVRACLDDGTAPALALALDCADQDSDVDPDLRERLDALVDSAASPDADPERRRLFAGILLRRHMRQRIRTSGDSQVCPRPLPADIYRLFLADTTTPEPDAPLEATGIAAGMRGSDANAFVRWANEISGAEQSYRLPLAAELSELANQQRIPILPSGHLPSVWTQADETSAETRPMLWVPPSAPDPRKVSNAVLASVIADDAIRSAPALSRLLLLRARTLLRFLDRALDLNLALDVALNRALALNRDLGRDVARDLARDLACDLARDVALDLKLARDLNSEPDLNRNLAGNLAFVLDRALDLDLDVALDLALDLARVTARDLILSLDGVLALAPALALALAPDLDRDRVTARDLVMAINEAVDRQVFWHSLSDLILPIFDGAFGLLLGRIFSTARTEARSPASRSPADRSFAWPVVLTVAFTDAARVAATGELTVDAAALEATLHEAVRSLTSALQAPVGMPRASLWPAIVAERLQQTAGPAFARAQRPTPEKATVTRLAALCLAVEADGIGREDISDMFRQVAAGITLVERRARGQQSASEVIMLAVVQPLFGAPVTDRDAAGIL